MNTNAHYKELDFHTENGIAVISINRPAARNSVTKDTCLELFDAVRSVAENSGISVLILRGHGEDFCCGADLYAKSRLPDDSAPREPEWDIHKISILLHKMPAITIAAIRGGCAGAGFGWACACDFRVAADDSVFNTAFLNVGVAGDMGVPWTLPRIIGAGRARDLSFIPRKIGADEALKIGLLDRLWRAQEFEEKLTQFSKQLLQYSKKALFALKANYVEAESESLEGYVMSEAKTHIRLLNSAESKDAFAVKLKNE